MAKPSSLIQRLFLAPYEFSNIFVLCKDFFKVIIWKRIQLFYSYNSNIFAVFFFFLFNKIVKNFT